MNMAKTMTMKTAILSGAALLALALAPGAARADSWPQLVTYQGVLLDSRGLAFAALGPQPVRQMARRSVARQGATARPPDRVSA